MSKRRFPTDLESLHGLAKVQREELARLRGVEAEQAELLRQKEEVIKGLADGLRAISMTVGISRRRHLTSCVRYGGRVFDEYMSECTAECHDARPSLDALEQLP